jgi:3'-phosphoadenosine 5'-phosphosulfate sulfotransferase (PAPS reductase)/FAD synthetase
MKTIVQFSGGKDSMAALLWTLENLTKNPIIVFCDTGFEAAETYKYIDYVEAKINLPIVRISSSKFDGMLDLVRVKKRFPSTNARFCTSELKVKPMIDFILDLNQDFIAIQGIRKDESFARSKMKNQCTYFKYYFEPYGFTKNGKPKMHTYKKTQIKKFVKERAADVLRPVFDWSASQVVEYILNKGFELNPLYKKGFKRVGCFPCIMCNQAEIKSLSLFYPDRIKEISDFENETGSSIFPPGKIPTRFCKNKSYPKITEVVEYLKEYTPRMFEQNTSCLSYYNICE